MCGSAALPSGRVSTVLTNEEEVLSPQQLMEVNKLAIARMETREIQGISQGAGIGGGQITSYLAGGPFNPMTDAGDWERSSGMIRMASIPISFDCDRACRSA